MNVEFLVIGIHQMPVNTAIDFVHTARKKLGELPRSEKKTARVIDNRS